MELVISLRRTSPVAVTTTCSSATGASRMTKSSVAVSPAATFTWADAGAKPRRTTRIVRGPAGTLLSRYSPFSLVWAPIAVPTTPTWAWGSGRLAPSTMTRPRTEPVACAARGEATTSARPVDNNDRASDRSTSLDM
jgi:hypothetical protein